MQQSTPVTPALYEEIFLHRGRAYNLAMQTYPHARDNEFLAVTESLGSLLNDPVTLVDIPAGGNYLEPYLPKNVNYVGLEVTQFADALAAKIVLWSKLPFEDSSVDVVVCLAALHHLDHAGRTAFYNEVFRVLKPKGIFLLADVRDESFVGKFLNVFCDKHNSMGHKGTFLVDSDLQHLSSVGFEDIIRAPKNYPWIFSNEAEMVEYTKWLFGLDKANDVEIQEGLKEYLIPYTANGKIQFDWELLFITCSKP